jgi:hypothetical protein
VFASYGSQLVANIDVASVLQTSHLWASCVFVGITQTALLLMFYWKREENRITKEKEQRRTTSIK